MSTKTTSGRPKRLQSSTKSAAFSEAAASITPPSWRGWLAIRPTGRPSRRAKAVTMFGAHFGQISSRLPPSSTASATSRTS